MGAAETKAGHEEEYVDGTSAAPWPQLDGVRPNTSPSLVDDGRRREDGEGRGGAKSDTNTTKNATPRLHSWRRGCIYPVSPVLTSGVAGPSCSFL